MFVDVLVVVVVLVLVVMRGRLGGDVSGWAVVDAVVLRDGPSKSDCVRPAQQFYRGRRDS